MACNIYNVALHAESVDRNVLTRIKLIRLYGSLSMRRAWIEIKNVFPSQAAGTVALHAESVDRNPLQYILAYKSIVALHAESVDRNYPQRLFCLYHLRRSPCGERG